MVPKSLAKWTTATAKAKQKGNLDRRPLCSKRASGKTEPSDSSSARLVAG